MTFFLHMRPLSVTGWCAVAVLISCLGCEGKYRAFGPGSSDNDAGGDQAVTALEPQARIDVEPSAIDLGWVTVGFPSRARVRLSNAGSVPLPVPVIDWSSNPSGDFELILNQCSTALAPGEGCELRVQLIPKLAGATAATLHVQSTGARATWRSRLSVSPAGI